MPFHLTRLVKWKNFHFERLDARELKFTIILQVDADCELSIINIHDNHDYIMFIASNQGTANVL